MIIYIMLTMMMLTQTLSPERLVTKVDPRAGAPDHRIRRGGRGDYNDKNKKFKIYSSFQYSDYFY